EPGGQKVGFVYKTSTVNVTASRPLLTELHPFYNGGDYSLLPDYPETADRFFASGRLPFLMEANVTVNGDTQEMKFIALHARANSGTGSQGRYDMRKYDVEVLKDYLDHYFALDKVMIMGDYNDDLDYTVANV
ncbi:endonuclease, partial [Tamlana crocina]|nr:endonuclease [Tamlana crocina]